MTVILPATGVHTRIKKSTKAAAVAAVINTRAAAVVTSIKVAAAVVINIRAAAVVTSIRVAAAVTNTKVAVAAVTNTRVAAVAVIKIRTRISIKVAAATRTRRGARIKREVTSLGAVAAVSTRAARVIKTVIEMTRNPAVAPVIKKIKTGTIPLPKVHTKTNNETKTRIRIANVIR